MPFKRINALSSRQTMAKFYDSFFIDDQSAPHIGEMSVKWSGECHRDEFAAKRLSPLSISPHNKIFRYLYRKLLQITWLHQVSRVLDLTKLTSLEALSVLAEVNRHPCHFRARGSSVERMKTHSSSSDDQNCHFTSSRCDENISSCYCPHIFRTEFRVYCHSSTIIHGALFFLSSLFRQTADSDLFFHETLNTSYS